MDNQEAIKLLAAKAEYIRRETSGIDVNCNSHKCDNCELCYTQGTMGEQKEALAKAISALEKQIPKKPVMGYAFSEKMREAIKRIDPERAESKTECCPVCGETLGVSRFVKAQTGLHVGDPYCKRCGQAIDLEDVTRIANDD